jgi:hypothetical protein
VSGSSLGFFLASCLSREFFLATVLLRLHCLLVGGLCIALCDILCKKGSINIFDWLSLLTMVGTAYREEAVPTNETAYREEVSDLTVWCQDNNLSLNFSKTTGADSGLQDTECRARPHPHRCGCSGSSSEWWWVGKNHWGSQANQKAMCWDTWQPMLG